MLISVDIISENIFDSHNYNVDSFLELKNEITKNYFISCENQEWYFNEKQIKNDFKLLKGNYTLYLFKLDYISLNMNINNNIIKLPFVSNELKILDLKDILSIKDNIYLNNIKLCDTKKLIDYNINSNNILVVKSININLI